MTPNSAFPQFIRNETPTNLLMILNYAVNYSEVLQFSNNQNNDPLKQSQKLSHTELFESSPRNN
jgi:hypothetical protein